MQNQNPSESETNSTSPERALAQQRLSEIHHVISEHISTTPVEGDKAQKITSDFGLEADEYAVYSDSLNGFASGLFRFIPQDPNGETLDGVMSHHIGGPTNDLNRYLYYALIHPGGDISQTTVTENSRGIKREEFRVSASSLGQDTATIYERHVRSQHSRVSEMTKEPAQSTRINELEPGETPSRASRGGGGILKFLKIGRPQN